MADDLDGEWWLETAETTNAKDGNDSDEGKAEDNSTDSGDEPSKASSVKKKSKGSQEKGKEKKSKPSKEKRKRKADDTAQTEEPTKPKKVKENEAKENGQEEQTDKNTEKKRKRKKKTKTEEIAEKPVVPLKPQDLVGALQKHYKDKLSTVEMDDIQVDEGENFCECNDMKHSSVSYMRSILPKWTKLLKGHSLTAMKEDSSICKGSPLVLIISSAALRATNLNRELESFKGDQCKTAKLFAKHIKIQEQIKFLSNNVIHLGVGTPSRIQALLENGSLSLENTKRVVIDWSWRDVKLRRLVEIPEIKSQLFELLRKYLMPRVKKGKCRIGLM